MCGFQQIYPNQYMQVPPMGSNLFLSPLNYYNAQQQRPGFVQPQVALLPGHQYQAYQFTQPQLSQTPQTLACKYLSKE